MFDYANVLDLLLTILCKYLENACQIVLQVLPIHYTITYYYIEKGDIFGLFGGGYTALMSLYRIFSGIKLRNSAILRLSNGVF